MWISTSQANCPIRLISAVTVLGQIAIFVVRTAFLSVTLCHNKVGHLDKISKLTEIGIVKKMKIISY